VRRRVGWGGGVGGRGARGGAWPCVTGAIGIARLSVYQQGAYRAAAVAIDRSPLPPPPSPSPAGCPCCASSTPTSAAPTPRSA
jgi:hypothetical protein